MRSFLRFLANRILSTLITLIIVTAVLYSMMMTTPPEVRAELYIPKGMAHLTEEQMANYIALIVKRYGLADPYPVQYFRWMSNLLQGNWGYSPMMAGDVLESLLIRTPVTAELTIYSLLFLIPLGIFNGVIAGWKRARAPDYIFRLAAFIAASIPLFILSLVLIAIFYVGLHWFPPERLGIAASSIVNSASFHNFTGLLTLDGFLNNRPDVSIDAARHLVLPVLTLSLVHWASLGRIVRMGMIEELQKEYVISARARGLSEWQMIWRHPYPNILSIALAHSALSAASLVTGVFVVERIYNFHGVSEIVINGLLSIPDAPAALGYTLYNVIVVLLIMIILDIMRGVVDPRTRENWGAK
jgi:ABC-type dipeptide/oligopeptide/nickel transport system permease component